MDKRHKKLKFAITVSSIGLTVLGGVVGGVTLKTIVLGCVSGPGVFIQTYVSKSNLPRKVEGCKFETVLLDDIVTDMCPPIGRT